MEKVDAKIRKSVTHAIHTQQPSYSTTTEIMTVVVLESFVKQMMQHLMLDTAQRLV